MRTHAVTAIVAKDLRLFTRDRFYAFVSGLGLVAYAALFWVLPATVEETVPVGIHLPGAEALIEAGLEDAAEEGLTVTVFESAAALEQAVAEGDDVVAGLDFPPGFLHATARGEATTVRVLLAGDAPAPLRDDLQRAHGQFPLFDFWGPKASIASVSQTIPVSDWLARMRAGSPLHSGCPASASIDVIHRPRLGSSVMSKASLPPRQGPVAPPSGSGSRPQLSRMV